MKQQRTVPITVTRKTHSYTIDISPGMKQDLWKRIAATLPADKYIVLADEALLPQLVAFPEGQGQKQWHSVVVRGGEQNKNWEQFQRLCMEMLALGPDRNAVVVAIGGGVTGDLAGFAASCLLRGVRLVMVPTTLLSMVDSSVGGKNGIDTPYGKNLLGTFYQPHLVLIDPEFLVSLPRREYIAGLGEVLKTAVLSGDVFFDFLSAHAQSILAMEHGALMEAVERCCRFKADVVMRDEQEQSGVRAILNLGHTFGHTLETLAGYDGHIVHGEAVAAGTVLAARFVLEKHCMDPVLAREQLQKITELTESLGLPARIASLGEGGAGALDWSKLLSGNSVADILLADKKSSKGSVTLVLPYGLGNCRPEKGFDARDVSAFMRAAL